MHCDNKTAAGIANDTVKKQRARSMEMRFFYITDQVNRGLFDVQWHPCQENLADYFTKHFDSKHHQEVRPWYLHMHNSPSVLPRAAAPVTLQGCAGTLSMGTYNWYPYLWNHYTHVVTGAGCVVLVVQGYGCRWSNWYAILYMVERRLSIGWP